MTPRKCVRWLNVISFLVLGSHRRTVDVALTTAGLPQSHLSPETQFPDGAGSWRQSDRRWIGNGIVGTRSGVGPYHDCLGPRAHIWDRFARYSADPPQPSPLDTTWLYLAELVKCPRHGRIPIPLPDPLRGFSNPRQIPGRTASLRRPKRFRRRRAGYERPR